MDGHLKMKIFFHHQPDQVNFTRIELKDLAERTKANIASGQLMVQLQTVPHGLVKSCDRGKLTENKRKNRYINLLPCKFIFIHLGCDYESLKGELFPDEEIHFFRTPTVHRCRRVMVIEI